MKDHPNIILVYTDQQRFDTLGCNGNTLIETPNLDRFASEGTRFERSYVNCPLCVPSRVSTFTGRNAHTTGSINNGIKMQDGEHDYVTAFLDSGYTTALIGKNHCFPEQRLTHRFDFIRRASHRNIEPELTDKHDRINDHRADTMQVPLADDPVSPEHNITGSLFGAAREYLREQRRNQQPFFLWLSIPDPHPPYMVCEPYASMYEDVDVPLPAWREGEMENKPDRQKLIVESGRTRAAYPEEDSLRDLKRTYWGMVSYIDDEFGKLMRTLETGDDNTIVVFTSDHGDYMGDHMMIRKGPHLYEALVHVPLIMRVPGYPSGVQSDGLVSNIDLMPTLADLAGIPGKTDTEGRSFSALLRGEQSRFRRAVQLEHGNPGKALRRDTVSGEHWEELKEGHANHLCAEICRGKTYGVVTDRWKFCQTAGDVDELYDLKSDPHELFNLSDHPEYDEVAARLKELKDEMVQAP